MDNNIKAEINQGGCREEDGGRCFYLQNSLINEIKVNFEKYKSLQKEELIKVKENSRKWQGKSRLNKKKLRIKRKTSLTDKRPRKIICRKCRATHKLKGVTLSLFLEAYESDNTGEVMYQSMSPFIIVLQAVNELPSQHWTKGAKIARWCCTQLKNRLPDIWNFNRFFCENMFVHSGPILHK